MMIKETWYQAREGVEPLAGPLMTCLSLGGEETGNNSCPVRGPSSSSAVPLIQVRRSTAELFFCKILVILSSTPKVFLSYSYDYFYSAGVVHYKQNSKSVFFLKQIFRYSYNS